LSINGQTLRIRDLGSHNGTYLNSNRVNEEVVQPGDIVKIGPLTFIIQINGHPDIPAADVASAVRKLSQKDISAGNSSLENLETSAGLDNINFDDINPPK
jgi:FHA domain.